MKLRLAYKVLRALRNPFLLLSLLTMSLGLMGLSSSSTVVACTGNGTVISNNGVPDAANASGAPDGSYASLFQGGDEIILDLGCPLASGTTINVTYETITGSGNAPVLEVNSSSSPVSGFTALPEDPVTITTGQGVVSTFAVTIPAGDQYLQIISDNGLDVGIDGIEFNCPVVTCMLTLTQSTQSACQDNGTPTDVTDDFFTVTINASAVLGGPTYEVVLGANPDGTGGTVLGTSAYGTAIVVGDGANGATGTFVADGSTTYPLTIRDASTGDCFTLYTTTALNDCTFVPSCNCQEVVYLNEVTSGGAVFKYRLEADGSLTEIGNPFFDNNAAGETLNSPHGLATDVNGNLYIGETSSGDIRRLECDGDIVPASAFEIPYNDIIQNMFTVGNTLYTNNLGGPRSYDICTGTQGPQLCLNDAGGNQIDPALNLWGFSYNSTTEMVYISSRLRLDNFPNGGGSVPNNPDLRHLVYVIPLADFEAGFANGACIDPFISQGNTAVLNVGDNFTPNSNGSLLGIVGDNSGNIYIVKGSIEGGNGSKILKYDANGNFLSESVLDATNGGGSTGYGFYQSIGLIWLQTSDLLYASNLSTNNGEDCVSVFEASDLTYLPGLAVPNPPIGGGQAKGINTIMECCPTSSNIVIDTVLCEAVLNQELFLQELINCQGTICEGQWDPNNANAGLTYNSCVNAVTIDALDACGTFTLSSDGLNNLQQCGAFEITVNIQVVETPTGTVSPDQDLLCPIGSPGDIMVTTNADLIQWQMSEVSCNAGFTDISGATNAVFSPPQLSTTTYYRAVLTNSSQCSSGVCDFISNCITINVEENCCPDPNCFDITVIRN